MNRLLLWTMVVGLSALPRPADCDQELSTPFTDVQLGPIRWGVPVDVRQAGGSDFILHNHTDQPLRVRIDVLVPKPSELRAPARPVPDTQWIRIQPNTLVLEPHQAHSCTITVNVPRSRKYRRKTYQAMIWSHTQPASEGNVSLNVGLLSRLRFTTE